jgi:regulator of replication initiation timing
MGQPPLKTGRFGVGTELRIQLERLRDENRRLRAENRRLRAENQQLRAALGSHSASAESPAGRGSMEITAGTCMGCDPPTRHRMPERAPDA